MFSNPIKVPVTIPTAEGAWDVDQDVLAAAPGDGGLAWLEDVEGGGLGRLIRACLSLPRFSVAPEVVPATANHSIAV